MNILNIIDAQWVRENPETALELIKIYRDENRKTINSIKVLEEKIQSLREMNLMKTILHEIENEEMTKTRKENNLLVNCLEKKYLKIINEDKDRKTDAHISEIIESMKNYKKKKI